MGTEFCECQGFHGAVQVGTFGPWLCQACGKGFRVRQEVADALPELVRMPPATCMHRWWPFAGGLPVHYACQKCGVDLWSENTRMHTYEVVPGTKAARPYYGDKPAGER